MDSSVAAALLQREGYEVVGCFMRLGSPGETFDELEAYDSAGVSCDPSKIKIGHQGCCSINDAADARLVAAKLEIPFYVCNFKKDFGRIIDYFVGEYNEGRTPNPCVRCNDWLKFGKLHEYAKQIDADFIASGHYARLDTSGGSTRLLRGVDQDKDQSYVLFGAPRDRLSEMMLPIGGYQKSKVREIAKEFDLPVFDKPDSQEICFVPDNDYAGLVKRRSPDQVTPGNVVDTSGKVLGEHEGHQHFTIGQRRGVGVALGYPIYVVHKDAKTNTITVGEKDDLKATSCIATEANWLVDEPSPPGTPGSGQGEGLSDWITCTAKIRYNAPPVPAQVRVFNDFLGATESEQSESSVSSIKGRTNAQEDSMIEVRFDEPQFAVAPGQAVVCYDGDAVICGGWIQKASDDGQ
ncbi:MAG: tRNA 2-thiouridine(34) synthase MnmA [Planctomycetota bacterium]|nr:tRNA 2-thiouridine(34) synthase MnmA [Planctomycetota bacterium]